MSDETLEEMLYEGTIYVDVGYDRGTPAARTHDAVLGVVELGGEISVKLYGYDDDLDPTDEPPLGSVEMWKDLLTAMRDRVTDLRP